MADSELKLTEWINRWTSLDLIKYDEVEGDVFAEIEGFPFALSGHGKTRDEAKRGGIVVSFCVFIILIRSARLSMDIRRGGAKIGETIASTIKKIGKEVNQSSYRTANVVGTVW